MLVACKIPKIRAVVVVSMIFINLINGYGQNEIEKQLNVLDSVIAEKEYYQQLKHFEIQVLKDSLVTTDTTNLILQCRLHEQLSNAYILLHYDSSLFHATEMQRFAYKLAVPELVEESKLLLGKLYVGSGIFIEAKDTLFSIDTFMLSDELKVNYFYTISRLYFDLADYYNKPHYYKLYTSIGLKYLDKGLNYTNDNQVEHFSLCGLKHVKEGDFPLAAAKYNKLFSNFQTFGQQFAIDASTLAWVYAVLEMPDKELEWIIKAAIEDVKIANKEYVALRRIANILFEKGEIAKSSEYLNIALSDAKSFGALQREFQIAQIQPIVEAARLDIIEQQRNRITKFAFAVSILSILVVIILILLFWQLKKVSNARNEVKNRNDALRSVNQKLREVNLIKEEYIGQFFKSSSDLIEKLDTYRQRIDNKLISNNVKELNSVITRKDIHRERDALFRSFDTAFLNIFPDFIQHYNSMFIPEDQYDSGGKNQLNTDLRIFALIRLGIHDTHKIGHILDYSVNTINTYKTKIKNKSLVSNDAFEKEIMKIQSV